MSPARERLLLIATTAGCGVLALGTATQTWAVVAVRALAAPLPVGGQAAAPAIAPVAVTVLAAAGALSIAGPVARRVLGVVLLLLGAGIAALGIPVVVDPLAAVRGAVTAATGQGGERAVADAVDHVGASAWPAVAVVAGVAVAVTGALVLWRAGHWPAGGRRYRAQPAAAVPPGSDSGPASSGPDSLDPIDEWDALTRGADPTVRSSGARAPGWTDDAGRTRGTDGPTL